MISKWEGASGVHAISVYIVCMYPGWVDTIYVSRGWFGYKLCVNRHSKQLQAGEKIF